MRFFLLIFSNFYLTYAYAECDFVTANHIDGLSRPENIRLIDFEIPKSSKHAKNLFKILTSKSPNIPSDLKKTFNTNVVITYDFGTCRYPGKIRQSGDDRDHIKLVNGNPVQSLDVKLKTGNVVGATRFKLLLPETRNGRNEILGSLLLRELDFIAPETFEVQVSVNGKRSLMLFQEKAVKELLEKNLRREGPIFEGDESILWSYQNYYNFELIPLALSRLVNDNWFNKGTTSQKIVIGSFNRLQKAYLDYNQSLYLDLGTVDYFYPGRTIQLNKKNDYSFNDYHLLVLAMNGSHALKPNNRQFYFNAIEDRFEPIYYDGDLNFTALDERSNMNTTMLSKGSLSSKLRDRLQRLLLSNDVKISFLKRLNSVHSAEAFYADSMQQLVTNLNLLENKWLLDSKINQDLPLIDSNYTWYFDFQKDKNLSQNIIRSVTLQKDYATLHMARASKQDITLSDLSKILSDIEIDNERFVILPDIASLDKSKKYKELKIGDNILRMSDGVKTFVDEANKKLEFTQANPSDWVLLLGGDYSNWGIKFKGAFADAFEFAFDQRFNEFGLTGCLTFYETKIDDARIEVRDGGCEDSLNLVRVRGNDIRISIANSFADALDADFSTLTISDLNIENAGNDCFDVSGGIYIIANAQLKSCNDKAISIGEMSSFEGGMIKVDRAGIGISAKDSSRVLIEMLDARGSSVCGEAKRKKQEFGGGFLAINKTTCNNAFNKDRASIIKVRDK